MTREQLNAIDLSDWASLIPEIEYRKYFLGDAGAEHYRLLASYSYKYNNNTLLDVGTFKGCSAIALSFNPHNKVVSFDIANQATVKKPENVEFVVGDILQESYQALLLDSPFIVLDTFHNGVFEREFLAHLRALNWHGTLMMDDIYLNDEMRAVWKEITERKTDMSRLGHWTGTGVIEF